MANRRSSDRNKGEKPVGYTIQIREKTKERLHKIKDTLKVPLYEALDLIVAGYEDNEKRRNEEKKIRKTA